MAKAKEKRAAVTYEDVKQAAKQIEAEGRDLTNANIYREIGRGSMTTINKFLQKYLAESVEEVGAQISKDFLQAFAREVMRVSDAKGAGLSKAFLALREYADTLEAANTAQQQELEAKTDEIAKLSAEVAKHKELAAELAQKLELAEKTYVARSEAAERMIEAARKEHEALKEAAATQQESYNELLVKFTRYESTNTMLQKERDELRNDLNALREKHESLQELYRTSSLSAKGQEIKIETMAEQNDVLRSRIAAVEKELAMCQGK